MLQILAEVILVRDDATPQNCLIRQKSFGLRDRGVRCHQFCPYPVGGDCGCTLRILTAPWGGRAKFHSIVLLFGHITERTGDFGGPGAVPRLTSIVPGRRLERGIARAGDLMSSPPADMRAENLICYIGHEGTLTTAYRETCVSLGHDIMVEASSTANEEGAAESGLSIWFMTESKDRTQVSE